MNILLMGAPGAGKGTVAGQITKSLDIPHISTGDMLRNAVKTGNELGKQVGAIMSSGKLVSDELMIELIKEKIVNDCPRGLILDGFPRTKAQAQALDKILKIDVAVYLDVSDEVVVKRLSGRRTSSKTGRVYNIYFDKPKVEGKCDETGTDLIQRDDDSPKTVQKRLEIFHSTTDSVVNYYEKNGLLEKIDGENSPEEVKKAVLEVVRSLSV